MLAVAAMMEDVAVYIFLSLLGLQQLNENLSVYRGSCGSGTKGRGYARQHLCEFGANTVIQGWC